MNKQATASGSVQFRAPAKGSPIKPGKNRQTKLIPARPTKSTEKNGIPASFNAFIQPLSGKLTPSIRFATRFAGTPATANLQYSHPFRGPDPPLRRLVLYPAELRARAVFPALRRRRQIRRQSFGRQVPNNAQSLPVVSPAGRSRSATFASSKRATALVTDCIMSMRTGIGTPVWAIMTASAYSLPSGDRRIPTSL